MHSDVIFIILINYIFQKKFEILASQISILSYNLIFYFLNHWLYVIVHDIVINFWFLPTSWYYKKRFVINRKWLKEQNIASEDSKKKFRHDTLNHNDIKTDRQIKCSIYSLACVPLRGQRRYLKLLFANNSPFISLTHETCVIVA